MSFKCVCGCGRQVNLDGGYSSKDCMVGINRTNLIKRTPKPTIEPIKRTRGRPRIWLNDAERKRAERKKA